LQLRPIDVKPTSNSGKKKRKKLQKKRKESMRNTKPDKIHTYEPIVRRKERKAPIPMNSGLPKKFQHFEFPIGDSVEKQKKK